MEEQQRIPEQHQEARQEQDVARLALAAKRQREKSKSAHDGRADDRRHAARENAVERDAAEHECSRDGARQAQERGKPGHDGRDQADVRARDGQDVHDARRLEVRDEFLLQALIAAKQHGKDCRSVFFWHGVLHALAVVRAHRSDEAPEFMAVPRLDFDAALARYDTCCDAIGAQQEIRVELTGILIAARQADLARSLHGIADARGLLRQGLRSRIEIALPRGLLPIRTRLFHLLHRHEIAHLVDAAAIWQDGWRPARLIHYRAAELDLRARKGSDVRWRQCEHGLQANRAEHEEEQQDGQSTERALAPEQNEH